MREIRLRLHLDYVVNLKTPTPQILDEVDDGINDEPPVVEVLDEGDACTTVTLVNFEGHIPELISQHMVSS